MFDPSCPSLSPDDSILLPIGKVAGYLDVTLKALTLHTEARTSFITYASSPYRSSHPINLTEYELFCFSLRVSFFSSNPFPSIHLPLPSHEMDGYSLKHSRGLNYIRADGHADIGFRVYSSMNTSPCDSSHKHRTKRRRRCTSRLLPTSSLAFSCSSAGSAQTMWTCGRLRQLGRSRRTARRSGRRSSVSMRFARPIARCSACWSGAGSKLSNLRIAGTFPSSLPPFLWVMR